MSPNIRIEKLKLLRRTILKYESNLRHALYEDYRKPALEVDFTEILSTISELDFAIKNLKKWAAPRKVKSSVRLFGTRSWIHYEPKGVVLIIGPWNYPFSLMIIPLISAIASGNCVILKPSELVKNTNHLLHKIIKEVFPEKEVALIEGGIEVAQELLQFPFDHIFFTGSTRVGQRIMESAAKHLIPVTLELGGKSPVIIEDSANLMIAAQRVVWGKFINAGQTCVAPDYVFVPERKFDEFLVQIKKVISTYYGNKETERQKSLDFCRIISPQHFQRLKLLTDEALQKGARLEMGGSFDSENCRISPTLLTHLTQSHAIMNEEIFGPILPILPYHTLEEVYSHLHLKQKPLALYIFSQNKKRTEEIITNTTSGGTCINTTLIHLVNPNLPFGGIGSSGMGSYHGFYGFKTFSHERAILKQGNIDLIRWLHPPYRNFQRKLVHFCTRFLSSN